MSDLNDTADYRPGLPGMHDPVAAAADHGASPQRLAQMSARTAQSNFLATMSHELRTPLNVVIGFSDAMMRESSASLTREQLIEYSASINEAGRQLLTLIDVILDVARVEAEHFSLPSDVVDVNHLLGNAVSHSAAAANSAELSLECNVPPTIPHLRADERRLRQAVGHIIANAIKFTPPGGAIRVSARQEPRTDDLLLLVSDTGIGVADADLERVFEPFVQLDASFARRFAGSGLGLYVSRITARAHGGELVLHSQLGVGTTVVLRLPAHRLVLPPDPPFSQ